VAEASRILHVDVAPARGTDAEPAPAERLAASSSPALALARLSLRGLRQLEGRGYPIAPPLPDDVCDPGAGAPARDASVGLLAQLRAGVTLHVFALRREGLPPERTLTRAKAMLREALAAEGWRDPLSAQVLMSCVVRWSIDAYFDR
jgi:hypothetical protein